MLLNKLKDYADERMQTTAAAMLREHPCRLDYRAGILGRSSTLARAGIAD